MQQCLQQERDEHAQVKAALIQRFNKDTTHPKETKVTLEVHLMEQKRNENGFAKESLCFRTEQIELVKTTVHTNQLLTNRPPPPPSSNS